MKPKFRLNTQEHEVSPLKRGDVNLLEIDGRLVSVIADDVHKAKQQFVIDGKIQDVYVARDGDDLFVRQYLLCECLLIFSFQHSSYCPLFKIKMGEALEIEWYL